MPPEIFLPSKSSKNAKKAENAKKAKKGKPSSGCTRPEYDHVGLFYHHGLGKKGWAAVVPPGGYNKAT